MNGSEHGQPVVCIFTSADGTSRLADGRIPLRVGERGVWSDSRGAKSWLVAKGLPAGGKDWHRGSTAVLSIVTSGAWEIEAGDGEKRLGACVPWGVRGRRRGRRGSRREAGKLGGR